MAERTLRVPSGVRQAAEEGIRRRRETGEGGSPVAFQVARILASGEVTERQLQHVARRHERTELGADEVSDLLWGGAEALRWSAGMKRILASAAERRDAVEAWRSRVSG